MTSAPVWWYHGGVKPSPKSKSADDELLLQNALNNAVAITFVRCRPTKKPWLREYAAELFGPALEAMAEEAFTPDEFICMMCSLLLTIECNRTGNWKKAPALNSASELISVTATPDK